MANIKAYLTVTILIVLILSGCSYARRPSNPETSVKMKLIGLKDAQAYSMRVVEDKHNQREYKVDSNGTVAFVFPFLGPACDEYLFGYILIKERNPYRRKAVYLMKEGSIIQKYSYSDIRELKRDKDGFSLLRLNH